MVNKFWTHKILTRKKFGPTKYPRKQILDPQRHDGAMAQDLRDPRWHETYEI